MSVALNDSALREAAGAWLDQGFAAIVVTVEHTQGSVPRHSGTRMLVGLGATPIGVGTTLGTIGGGHLEWRAIEHARRLLGAEPLAMKLKLPLGPALGQCCGGTVTLSFAPLSHESLAAWPRPSPLFHLQLYGAGHVGRAIARAIEPFHVQVDWIDERHEPFPEGSSPAHIRRVAVDAVEAEVNAAPEGAFYLVLTHSHDLDLRITHAILKRGDFAFLGLIGSATKRARFVHRLEAMGLRPDTLARMTCPIGLEGIPGKEPEVIAASVVAQLLQQHARRSAHAATHATGIRAMAP